MADEFELPVVYKGKQWSLPARLVVFGYSYKIQVDVEGKEINFERDDEGKWRALSAFPFSADDKEIDKELLRLMSEALDELL